MQVVPLAAILRMLKGKRTIASPEQGKKHFAM